MSKQRTFKAFLLVIVILFLIGAFYYNVIDRPAKASAKPAQAETLVTTEPVVIKPVVAAGTAKISKPIVSNKAQNSKKLIVDYSLNLNYPDTTTNSIANAKLALDIINNKNGYILRSGQIFSFNNVVGMRSYSRGFVDAPLIKGIGVGGGVCKASTAVYQSALEAGLKIIERHNHSKQVQYAKLGTDAMVNFGTDDNIFQNNSGNDLLFVCSLDAHTRIAYIKIYKLFYDIENVHQ